MAEDTHGPLGLSAGPAAWWGWLRHKGPEIRQLLSLSWPVMLGFSLTFFTNTITLIFIGHYDSPALGGAALANMYCIVTGYAPLFGLSGFMETLGSQSFGAGNFRAVGLLLLRGAAMLFLLCIPVAIGWGHCTPILVALQQDPALALIAGQYVRYMTPGYVMPFLRGLPVQLPTRE